MRITWFGHSNFLLEADGKRVLIDPFFDGNPKAPISWESVGKVDAVLLTHDHRDHLGQTVVICKATGAKLVCIFDLAGKLQEQGVPAENILGMNLGGTVDAAGVRVKMVPALHSAPTGSPAGYIITFPGGFCTYHSGDTALFSDMKLFRRFFDIDLAILPIGGRYTMDANEAAVACSFLACRTVVPMHWGTFPVLEQNTDAFATALKEHAPGVQLAHLSPGASVDVE